MSDVDEERIERARQEMEAAWAVVEEELWWLFSLPEELFQQSRELEAQAKLNDPTFPLLPEDGCGSPAAAPRGDDSE